MGRQLYRTSWKQRLISGNNDEVIAGMPIPRGGTLKNVWGDVHLIATANLDRDLAAGYALSGYILPHMDTTFTVDYDVFWDQMVPKDNDVSLVAGVTSVDTAPETADSSPAEEPGEASTNRLFNVFNFAERVYHREKLLTIASRGLFEPVAASEVDLWMPNDHFTPRVTDNYRVDMTSYALFGLSSFEWDDVTTANETTLDANTTVMLENMELAIKLAMPQIIGLTETGAESPFDTLAALIEELVEPTVEEQTAGAFADVTWRCFSRFTFEVELPSDLAMKGPIAG